MIIDTHVHIFDPFRPQGAPWPDAKNELLYRTTLPQQVKEQAVPEGVVGAVVVEASEWPKHTPEELEGMLTGLARLRAQGLDVVYD